ncbi:STAS domain-containing protein [Micromonospora echinospora]
MTAEDQVTVRSERGCTVIQLNGDVDHGNAEVIEQEVLVLARAAAGVVIDLGGVTFLDSAGLRCLDRLVSAFQNRQLAVMVVAPNQGVVRSALDLIGFLPDFLTVSIDEAIGRLTSA